MNGLIFYRFKFCDAGRDQQAHNGQVYNLSRAIVPLGDLLNPDSQPLANFRRSSLKGHFQCGT